jgi:hypothetical protein
MNGLPARPLSKEKQGQPVHPLCREAFLEYLIFRATPDDEDPVDYCHDVKVIPARVKALLEQMGALNRATAEALHQDPNRLFKKPISVTFYPAEFGPSEAQVEVTEDGHRLILMPHFPNWKGNQVVKVIYVHELGHLIAHELQVEAAASKWSNFGGTVVPLVQAFSLSGIALIRFPA